MDGSDVVVKRAVVQDRMDPAPGYLEGSKGVLLSQNVSQEPTMTDEL